MTLNKAFEGFVMGMTEKEITLEYVRSILKEGKPINELMQDIMKVGKKITDEIGHRDYNSIEEFLEDINAGTSPLFQLDRETDADVKGSGLNIFSVRKCPLADLMDQMTHSEDQRDHGVSTALKGFQIREGEGHEFIDLGCYIMQQLRQMLISSITIKGEPILNYMHLACKRSGHKTVYSEGDVADIEMSKDLLEQMLEDHHCIYAVFSTKEE